MEQLNLLTTNNCNNGDLKLTLKWIKVLVRVQYFHPSQGKKKPPDFQSDTFLKMKQNSKVSLQNYAKCRKLPWSLSEHPMKIVTNKTVSGATSVYNTPSLFKHSIFPNRVLEILATALLCWSISLSFRDIKITHCWEITFSFYYKYFSFKISSYTPHLTKHPIVTWLLLIVWNISLRDGKQLR